MSLLKLGSQGSTVRSVQEILIFLGFKVKEQTPLGVSLRPLVADGIFSREMESVVLDFQSSEGILCDGIVGPTTLRTLQDAYQQRVLELNIPTIESVSGVPSRLILERLPADKWNNNGYDRLSLRSDVAADYRKVFDVVRQAGGLMTSSGGIRSLNATVTKSRSAVSFHYLGRALDLFIYSGMVDPMNDPYVIDREDERKYRVYARCSKKNNPDALLPQKQTVKGAISYTDRTKGKKVSDNLLDLTALFDANGFKPIQPRRRFEEGDSLMGAEWWHFQHTRGLVEGVTTFGYELLKLYSETTLVATPPWRERDRIFGINWF